jgi:formylmethanofuran:tetrahydromethanopterin formyltransferase
LLTINHAPIEDTFAEAFPMTAARLIVTRPRSIEKADAAEQSWNSIAVETA